MDYYGLDTVRLGRPERPGANDARAHHHARRRVLTPPQKGGWPWRRTTNLPSVYRRQARRPGRLLAQYRRRVHAPRRRRLQRRFAGPPYQRQDCFAPPQGSERRAADNRQRQRAAPQKPPRKIADLRTFRLGRQPTPETQPRHFCARGFLFGTIGIKPTQNYLQICFLGHRVIFR